MACLHPSVCFLIVLLFTAGHVMGGEKVLPKDVVKDGKRCTEGLGLCSVKECDEACCKRKCNNDYSSLHPQGYCDNYPGFPGFLCLCDHDCFKA